MKGSKLEFVFLAAKTNGMILCSIKTVVLYLPKTTSPRPQYMAPPPEISYEPCLRSPAYDESTHWTVVDLSPIFPKASKVPAELTPVSAQVRNSQSSTFFPFPLMKLWLHKPSSDTTAPHALPADVPRSPTDPIRRHTHLAQPRSPRAPIEHHSPPCRSDQDVHEQIHVRQGTRYRHGRRCGIAGARYEDFPRGYCGRE